MGLPKAGFPTTAIPKSSILLRGEKFREMRRFGFAFDDSIPLVVLSACHQAARTCTERPYVTH